MTDENVKHTKEYSPKRAAHGTDEYDPFVRGRFPIGVRTIQGLDTVRDRRFPCEIWYPAAAQHLGLDITSGTQDILTVPSKDTLCGQMAVRNSTAQPGTYPLIIFSHSSGGNRRQSTFLCTHLSSHGYLVAALDHSEVVAAELARKEGEADEQKTARVEAWIANRVPDIRFLLDHLLNDAAWDSEAKIDPTRIGIVGHSFGGWTALAATEVEQRIRAVVALAPGGSSQPKPGIIPGTLTLALTPRLRFSRSQLNQLQLRPANGGFDYHQHHRPDPLNTDIRRILMEDIMHSTGCHRIILTRRTNVWRQQ